MTGDYEYQAYQSGNQLNIGITKPALLREPTLEEKSIAVKRCRWSFKTLKFVVF